MKKSEIIKYTVINETSSWNHSTDIFILKNHEKSWTFAEAEPKKKVPLTAEVLCLQLAQVFDGRHIGTTQGDDFLQAKNVGSPGTCWEPKFPPKKLKVALGSSR